MPLILKQLYEAIVPLRTLAADVNCSGWLDIWFSFSEIFDNLTQFFATKFDERAIDKQDACQYT